MFIELFVASLLISISTACDNQYDLRTMSLSSVDSLKTDLRTDGTSLQGSDIFKADCQHFIIRVTREYWKKLLQAFPDGVKIPIINNDKVAYMIGETHYDVIFEIIDTRRRLQTSSVGLTTAVAVGPDGTTSGAYSYEIDAQESPWTSIVDDGVNTPTVGLVDVLDFTHALGDLVITLCKNVDWTRHYIFAIDTTSPCQFCDSEGGFIKENVLLVIVGTDTDCTYTTLEETNLATLQYNPNGYYTLHSPCLFAGLSQVPGCCSNSDSAFDHSECDCLLPGNGNSWTNAPCPHPTTTDTPETTDGCYGCTNDYGSCELSDGTCLRIPGCYCCKPTHDGVFTSGAECPIVTTAATTSGPTDADAPETTQKCDGCSATIHGKCVYTDDTCRDTSDCVCCHYGDQFTEGASCPTDPGTTQGSTSPITTHECTGCSNHVGKCIFASDGSCHYITGCSCCHYSDQFTEGVDCRVGKFSIMQVLVYLVYFRHTL